MSALKIFDRTSKLVQICMAELTHGQGIMAIATISNYATIDLITNMHDICMHHICTYEIYTDSRYVAVSKAIIGKS